MFINSEERKHYTVFLIQYQNQKFSRHGVVVKGVEQFHKFISQHLSGAGSNPLVLSAGFWIRKNSTINT